MEHPLARHGRIAGAVIASRDPAAIKRLYIELGADWADAMESLDEIPVLSFPEVAPAVVAHLSTTTGLVLDAGCGPNPATSIGLARQAGRRVVALDIAPGTVRVARHVAADEGLEVLGVAADVEHLPFRAGAFDAVVCDDTIEHLPDDAAGLRELARITRRGGHVVITTPNRWRPEVILAKLRDLLRRRRRAAEAYFCVGTHLREYTWRDLERKLPPGLALSGRVPIGWVPTSWRRTVATRFVSLPAMHVLSQVVCLDAERR